MDQERVNEILNKHEKDVLKDIRSGMNPAEIIEKYQKLILKEVFTKRFMITIELPAPDDATLTQAANRIEQFALGAKVVHIEEMEVQK